MSEILLLFWPWEIFSRNGTWYMILLCHQLVTTGLLEKQAHVQLVIASIALFILFEVRREIFSFIFCSNYIKNNRTHRWRVKEENTAEQPNSRKVVMGNRKRHNFWLTGLPKEEKWVIAIDLDVAMVNQHALPCFVQFEVVVVAVAIQPRFHLMQDLNEVTRRTRLLSKMAGTCRSVRIFTVVMKVGIWWIK